MVQSIFNSSRSFGLGGGPPRWAEWLFWGVLGLILAAGLGGVGWNPDVTGNRPSGPVVISEFSATGGELFDVAGDTPDWIELHNRSRRPVDLDGWTLTDDPTQPDKWTFDTTVIEPGGYLIVFASGKNQRRLNEENPSLHTNFRLSSAGGHLALYPPTTRRYLDATRYDYPEQVAGVSYGMVQGEDGRWSPRYLGTPTPGAANDTSITWSSVLPPVRFSTPHGLYEEPVQVSLIAPVEGAEVRYTTDGSVPTLDTGALYTAPLTLTTTTTLRAVAFLPDALPSSPATQSYIFPEDVLDQPDEPEGFPLTWGTHRIDIGPYQAGTPVEADYAMDPTMTRDPQTREQLREALYTLPTLSLVTDIDNLDIYADPQTRGREMERPVSVEWFDPSNPDSAVDFSVNAGIRIQGGAGRWEFMPKHSFRLFFRNDYGPTTLAAPIFASTAVTDFNTLILRAGSNESFAGHPPMPGIPVDFRVVTYLRDEWARASQIAMSGYGVHGTFVHLYLNGLYWGLYNVVERPDADFAAAYFGGRPEQWGVASHSGPVDGPQDRIKVLFELAQQGGLDDPERYATFLEFIDPVEFCDYLVLNWYMGADDWPENNWYIMVQNPAGRNRFIMWDGESSWHFGADIRLGTDGWEGAPYPNVIKLIFEAAWANPDFRQVMADRLYANVTGEGALTDERSLARWQALAAQIDPGIMGESARWGDVRVDPPVDRDDWVAAVERIAKLMDGNADRLLRLAREEGYYPAVEPPQITPGSQSFGERLTVTLEAPAGEIYFTTDGSDPRASGGAISQSAQRYEASLVLTSTTTLHARVLEGETWSALATARFANEEEAPHLVLTEIMYNPYLDEEMEFIELQNRGNLAIDLSGATFHGLDFRFSEGAVYEPGQYIVLARDLKKYRRRYGDAPVHGIYNGKLSDKGETLTLIARDGTVLLSASYGTGRNWPLSANGAGDSLVVIDPDGDLHDPRNYRASTTLYGTPGRDEAP